MPVGAEHRQRVLGLDVRGMDRIERQRGKHAIRAHIADKQHLVEKARQVGELDADAVEMHLAGPRRFDLVGEFERCIRRERAFDLRDAAFPAR